MSKRATGVGRPAVPVVGAVVGLLAVGGVVGAAALAKGKGVEPVSAPVAVSVSGEGVYVVGRGVVESGPAISGSLQPGRKAVVRAEAAGTLVTLSVEVGESVAAGSVIGRIDDSAIRDSYASAQMAVRAATEGATVAQRNLQRMVSLEKEGAVAANVVESARTSSMSAERALAEAQAMLAHARKSLGKTVITSPIAGVIAERPANAGDALQLGAPIATVVDPRSMQLEASVPSQQLSSIRVGAPVSFRVSGYTDVFTGRVDRVSPLVDAATRQVRLFISIPNTTGRLVGGLYAEGRVMTASRQGITVPATALERRRDDGLNATAMRVRGGVAEIVPVKIGLIDDRSSTIEITSGVGAGDTLLVGAARTITPGTRVQTHGR